MHLGYKSIVRVLLLSVMTLWSCMLCNAQCSFPSNIPILDDSTQTISITIDGAVDNSLSSNGLCGVQMRFRHTVLGDVRMVLYSPFGDSVVLVGPGVELSNRTDFTLWDITILPRSATPNPDLGFPPVFDGTELWGQLSTYNGSYWPNRGNLEDLDQGTVNGNWTLVISDVSIFDSGVLEAISLIFCDDTGIDCKVCDARKGFITSGGFSACQGSDDLVFRPATIPSLNVTDTNYLQYFVIQDTSTKRIVAYTDSIDMRLYSPSVYAICYLDLLKDDTTNMPAIGQLVVGGLQSAISQAGVCAALSNCIYIEIQQAAAIQDLNFTICRGDTLRIFGQEYLDAGVFTYVKSGTSLCDSLFRITVDVPEVSLTFNPSSPTVRCDRSPEILSVSVAGDMAQSYEWSSIDGNIIGSTTQDQVSIDTTGMYKVIVMADGCEFMDSVTVTQATPSPSISLTADTIDCIDDFSTVRIISSQTLISRVWTPNVLTQSIFTAIVNRADTYTLLATDANGCTGTASITVVADTLPPDILLTADTITCNTSSSNITIDGITSDITYKWTNATDFDSLDVSPNTSVPGMYIFTAVGENSCVGFDTVHVIENKYDIDVNLADRQLLCSRRSLAVSPSIDNGSPPYDTRWYDDIEIGIGNTITIVDSGTYSVVVIDANGCVGSDTFNVTADFELPIIITQDTIFRCIDDSIQITVDNFNPNYTYMWKGPFMFDVEADAPFIQHHGEYNVIVTTNAGCVDSTSIIVLEGLDLPKSAFQVDTFRCSEDTINITPLTNASYTFTWEGPGLVSATSEKVAVLSVPGYYTVTVTDLAANCQNAYEFTIPDDRDFVEREVQDILLDCANPVQTPLIVGVDTIVAYRWEVADTLYSSDSLPSFDEAGTYYAYFTSKKGCIVKDTFLVATNKSLPSIEPSISTILCNPDSALQIVNSNIGVEFVWKKDGVIYPGDSIYTTIPGSYTLVVTGNNGCIDSQLVEIPIDTIAPTFTLGTQGSINCQTDTITLEVRPAPATWIFDWVGANIITNRGNEIDINGGGVYLMAFTDERGCTFSDSIVVDDIRVEPSFSLINDTITCRGAAVPRLVDLVNVDSIIWTGPFGSFINVDSLAINASGVYTVTAYSVLGCDYTQMAEITIDTLTPNIISTVSDTITCLDSVATIGVVSTSDIEYVNWAGPESGISEEVLFGVEVPGTYMLEVIGANGCVNQASIDVEIDTLAPGFNIIGDTITCLKSKVKLKVDNVDLVNVLWTGNGISQNGLEATINKAGLYSGIGIYANGCINEAEIEIYADLDVPELTLADTFFLPCDGDPAILSITADKPLSIYRWFSPTFFSEDANPEVNEAMLIRVFAAGSNGCNSIDSTYVVVDDRPIDYDYESTIVNCTDKASTLTALRVSDDESFYWRLSDGNIINNQDIAVTALGGTHYLVVNRGNKCLDSTGFEIPFDTIKPQVSIVYQDIIKCDKQDALIQGVITPNGSRTYTQRWLTQGGNITANQFSQIVSINGAGNYIYIVQDDINGCIDTAMTSIEEVPNNFNEIGLVFDIPACKGDDNGWIEIVATKGATNPLRRIFNTKDVGGTSYFSGLSAGSYDITVIDSFGCVVDTSIRLDDGFDYTIGIIGDTIIDLGDTATLNFTSSFGGDYDGIIWSSSDEILCDTCITYFATPIVNTIYDLLTITDRGCESRAMILVRVNPDIQLDFPNIISLSAIDEQNRVFKIPNLNEIEEVISVGVYDRWGSRMYYATNFFPGQEIGWDGTINGEAALPGVYVVMTRLRLKNGNIVEKVFDLTLYK